MFGKRMIGMMGIPVPGTGESDMGDMSLHERTTLKPFEILINDEPITVRCYSMNHALKLASNLPLVENDVVAVKAG